MARTKPYNISLIGLGIYLGVDHLAAIIHEVNPNITVRGMSDSGYFLDYSSNLQNFVPKRKFSDREALVNGTLDYQGSMRRIFDFMNISAGANADCLRYNSKQQSNCVFAKYLLPHIHTPLFILQVSFGA